VTLNCVIIDFVRARNRRHAPQVDQEASKKRETRLAMSDSLMLAYIVAAAAFYPAIAWLLLS
jgi:hypothetical protein